MTMKDEYTTPEAETNSGKPENAPAVKAVKAGDGKGTGPSDTGTASAIAKVTSVTGEKVEGMNYGPSIGRFDNPPAVAKSTGTPESISAMRNAIESRHEGIDTEHVTASEDSDRTWR